MKQNKNDLENINKSENAILIINKSIIYNENSLNIMNRGKTKCFFYFNGEPLIVIGPHCNFFNNRNLIYKGLFFYAWFQLIRLLY